MNIKFTSRFLHLVLGGVLPEFFQPPLLVINKLIIIKKVNDSSPFKVKIVLTDRDELRLDRLVSVNMSDQKFLA